MKEDALRRIEERTRNLPERWREVLKESLLSGEFQSEADLLLQSALAIHSNYSPNMEPAESILAGDAFIPMSIESMIDNEATLEEIEEFLNRVVGLFDR
jgi:hypothetical protein